MRNKYTIKFKQTNSIAKKMQKNNFINNGFVKDYELIA
jgi:hypothetical protein